MLGYLSHSQYHMLGICLIPSITCWDICLIPRPHVLFFSLFPTYYYQHKQKNENWGRLEKGLAKEGCVVRSMARDKFWAIVLQFVWTRFTLQLFPLHKQPLFKAGRMSRQVYNSCSDSPPQCHEHPRPAFFLGDVVHCLFMDFFHRVWKPGNKVEGSFVPPRSSLLLLPVIVWIGGISPFNFQMHSSIHKSIFP